MRGCPPEGTGTCRQDPIPPGVYWLDVVHGVAADGVERQDHFAFWLAANRRPATDADRVTVLTATEYDDRTWVLFRVSEPVNRWSAETGLALPTVAPRGTQTIEEDTVQKPPPEKGPLDFLTNTTLGIPTWAWGLGAVLAVYVVVKASD